eukprot:CAMPEP_0170617498 /NCGR_PEP_ID=MMETSP0224-20130122/26452_1 /TAXON_ID=285029 /ORGANISM="Togula jolla, Strain CCCM 725" /LENGTH=307 /DNA_ID=CAMNT_0010943399 /DNA_START=12 /DNA_END=932 /DNA_ORIENTATION=-
MAGGWPAVAAESAPGFPGSAAPLAATGGDPLPAAGAAGSEGPSNLGLPVCASAGSAGPKTKGQRLLHSVRPPAPHVELPAALREEALLRFDPQQFDLSGAIAGLLGLESDELLSLYSLENDSYVGSFPKSIHERARSCLPLAEQYERLIREVVGPHLLQFFPGERVLLYQFPPTLRVHCSGEPPKALGRLHCDAQYGHQPGEVNFWMPLTQVEETSTLWAESSPGLSDWRPFLLTPGEIRRFHGTSCRHFTRPNTSGRSRVSLDFRCVAKKAFDPAWRLPNVVHRHELREMHFGNSGEGPFFPSPPV